MSGTTVATMTKMLEDLPYQEQERVVEHMREYIEDLRDERQWDEQFQASQPELVMAAQKARKQIA